MHQFFSQFLSEIRATTLLEYIAVFSGIVSVWYSKRENLLLYPTGLVNTIIYIYLSLKMDLFGEASVNLYYTIVSIYGWILWSRKNQKQEHVLRISWSSSRDWVFQILFFSVFYVAIFFTLTYVRQAFQANTIPWADALASATAYTGMWLMAKKKVESWYWWLATDLASIPLYAIKGLAFTSIYYLVLFGLAVSGLMEWISRARGSGNKTYFAAP
jgi:nicotinamide mononucleotide transporter